MKTPKRIAYCRCGCALNLECDGYYEDGRMQKKRNVATLFCPKCGMDYRGENFAARIKRKNREARLRHALRKAKQQLELKEAEIEGSIRARAMLKRILFEEKKLATMYRNTIKTSGTYGQNIEGS